MLHHTTAKVSEDIRGCGGIGKYVGSIELTVNFVELKMTSLTSLVHKMNAKVDMLRTVTGTHCNRRKPHTKADQAMQVSLSANT